MSTPDHSREAEAVRFETRDTAGGRRIGFARLCRPQRMNALDLSMCERLLAQLHEWASDESVACVVLDAEGERAFCSGGDVVGMIAAIRAGGPRRYVLADRQFAAEYRLVRTIFEFAKPIVTWAHGVTMGAGFGLAVAASHRVVSPGLRMAMPETRIGLFPDIAATWFLERVPDHAGPFVGITGAVLGEADALQSRLADWVIDVTVRDAVHAGLVATAWSGDAREDAARLVDVLAAHATVPGQLPPGHLAGRRTALRRIGQSRTVAQFHATVVAEARNDPWIAEQLASLETGSALSVHVGFEHFRRMRGRSLRETLAADLALARVFTRGHDFPEGVRAALIDKDRRPAWAFAHVRDVPASAVNVFFAGS